MLSYCEQPQSRLSILENLGLYNNSRNFENYIKPLIEFDWLNQTIPNKPTSKNQQYVTDVSGKYLVSALSKKDIQIIRRIPVASSNIASVGYDAEKMILEIEFHHGAIYRYFDVPKEVYEGLINAPSQSAYFAHEIKEKYSYNKIN